MKEITLSEIGDYIKALHCDIRWVIIEILRNGPKSSDEIYQILFNQSEEIKENMKKRHNGQCKGNCHHQIN
ncbi:MAG: hypothetical protein ACFFAO_05375, partial [Candidatus Hermodarchaeota archaeon]